MTRSSVWARAVARCWPFPACLLLVPCEGPRAAERPAPQLQHDEAAAVFEGRVRDDQAPIAGATVRVQASDRFTTTDSAGCFTLSATGIELGAILTASAPGYYIGGGLESRPGDPDLEIVLERHAVEDHPEYAWVSSFAAAGVEQNCENCHASLNDGVAMPFDQWRRDAHAGSARNVRFRTMYLGTDVHGNQSPPTRYRQDRDYGRVPIRPATDQSYYGPGYRLDFPETAGNCAACHAPMAAIDDPYGVDPSRITGVASEGIACDFCHKIWDVALDPATDLPFANRPGVLSYEFRRPAQGHQFFAGPFDDVAPGEDVYSPVQSESRYCAPCHFAEFWDIEIYGSYGEWLRSDYARPGATTTCQDCHMPSGSNDVFATADSGGRRRNPNGIPGHLMPGAADEDLLRNAVEMAVDTELGDEGLQVRVEILNDRTGHHIPTDSPLRQMLLVVRATDDDGTELRQREGPSVPDWCGVGEPERGYLGGLAGTAYAKILEELWTGVSPTGAYWNPVRIVSDNRIPAFGADTTSYLFEAPVQGDAIVDVQLRYRREYIDLRDRKGWEGKDIEMERETVIVAGR